MNFIIWIVVGGILGWLASLVMRTDAQQGLFLNIVVGIVGALLGGWLLAPLFGTGTINQNDFSNPDPSAQGDTFGDRTEFDLVNRGSGITRAYVGDASDDFALDDDPTNDPAAWRSDDVHTITGSTSGALDNAAQGWIKLSSSTNGDSGFAANLFCSATCASSRASMVSKASASSRNSSLRPCSWIR